MMGMVGRGRVYRVEAIDGRVECPVCHTIIDSGDYDRYELLDIDYSYYGDISSITIRCSRCGAVLEVL